MGDDRTDFLHVLLFTAREVQHLVGIFDEDSALRLRLRSVDRVGKYGDFSLRDLLHIACTGVRPWKID